MPRLAGRPDAVGGQGPLRSRCLPVLLGLTVAVAVTCKLTERRTRRVMAAISTALSHAGEEGREVALADRSYGEEVEDLLTATEATLDVCRRMRWFAADLSHELRTPLTALRTELEEAQLHPGHVDVPRLVDMGLRSIERADAVLANMLMLARLQSAGSDPERFDLLELVREETTSAIGHHAVHLRPSEAVTVSAVREQIRQALANLIDNAQRHAAGRVDVEVRHDDGMACLIVDDDGDGIAVDDRERVFQRFTRLDGDRRHDEGGAGLGLSVTRVIAEAHGGTVQVEDSPQRGARFVLRLPAG
ncbi:hypothetical protein GCM10009530_61100 [Microbispora corallina]|uniref:histidine kinase n=1 Tax=Microbispora corallina TaxID=83302 RepID=A0ABQ4G8C1_9ACTN|nr:HAMP domain-containing sensor histidine kinase [Microbispora corallina]GIH43296.1 hypothetical protein Mco01_62960 [Microbispora corallina]